MLTTVQLRCTFVVMNTVTSTILRNNLADTLDLVENKKDFILISSRGKIKSAIVNIDMLEDLLALANSKYKKDIEDARKNIEKGEVYPFDEIFGKI